METIQPILLLLNRTSGEEAGFEMSTECTCLINEIREEKRRIVAETGEDTEEFYTFNDKFPLFTSHPYRFEASKIQAVREIGEKCSTPLSLIRIFRLHPLLALHARIESRDGFEKLVIDKDVMLEALLKKYAGVECTVDLDVDAFRKDWNELQEAFSLQEVWTVEDEEQWIKNTNTNSE
jgi:hypothetical protein